MNNKGFTIVELLATLVVLAIVVGITFAIVNTDFGKTKAKTEELFVDTIRDAMDMYLSSNAKDLTFVDSGSECTMSKNHGIVKVYKAVTNFSSVINSDYHPITQDDLVNPADEDKDCANASDIEISIYRDEDYVYYYKIDKSEFKCLKNIGEGYDSFISNLPEGYDC